MSDKPRLFGTDGVRGVAGEYPLDPETVWKLGHAIGQVLQEGSSSGVPVASRAPTEQVRVVLGRDTRESGEWLARRVADGLSAAGVRLSDVGVITTPGVAFLARHHGFNAGVVISASHNPYRDNGIKLLSTAGTKFPEVVEFRIEQSLDAVKTPRAIREAANSAVETRPELAEDYLRYLQSIAADLKSLSQLRAVMDCANGAASVLGPELMARLGVRTHAINASPDGRNINRDCGSLYPQAIAKATASAAADLGVAFDGDADRAIFATPS